MSLFSKLLHTVQATDQPGRYTVEIDDTWVQGRTTFGGLTVCVVVHAIQKEVPNDRALRNLAVTFVGPVPVGKHEISIRTLREGGSVTHFQGEMTCNGEVAVSVAASFAKGRDSRLKVAGPALPDAPLPTALNRMPLNAHAPSFLKHFDLRFVAGSPPFSNSDDPDCKLWLTFAEETPCTLAAIVALADVPPVPGMSMMKPPGAGSSLSWYLEFPSPNALSIGASKTPWLYYDYRAQSAADGYFHNYATVWNEEGTPVLYSRQVATLFEK